MTANEKRRAAQRDSAGNLAYRVGFAGGTSDRADDLTGRKPKNVAEAACSYGHAFRKGRKVLHVVS